MIEDSKKCGSVHRACSSEFAVGSVFDSRILDRGQSMCSARLIAVASASDGGFEKARLDVCGVHRACSSEFAFGSVFDSRILERGQSMCGARPMAVASGVCPVGTREREGERERERANEREGLGDGFGAHGLETEYQC